MGEILEVTIVEDEAIRIGIVEEFNSVLLILGFSVTNTPYKVAGDDTDLASKCLCKISC